MVARILATACALAAPLAVQGEAHGNVLEYYMGDALVYTSVADVTAHASIALDVAEMKTALVAGEWDTAKTIFQEGKNSPKGDSKRTLESFGKDLTGEPLYDEFVDLYGSKDYSSAYTLAAIEGTGAFAGKSDLVRSVAVQKNNMCLMAMYANHEAEKAKEKAAAGIPADDGTNNKYFDEYFAFYFGLDGKSSPTEVSKKRDADFSTSVQLDSFETFNTGLAAAVAADLAGIEAAQAAIIKGMTITYLQAAYKYSYKVQKDPASTGKEWAEGYTYWRCISGHVHASSAAGAVAAAAIETAFGIHEGLDAPAAGVFCTVQEHIMAALPGLGLTETDLGDLTEDHGNSMSIPEDFCDGGAEKGTTTDAVMLEDYEDAAPGLYAILAAGAAALLM